AYGSVVHLLEGGQGASSVGGGVGVEFRRGRTDGRDARRCGIARGGDRIGKGLVHVVQATVRTLGEHQGQAIGAFGESFTDLRLHQAGRTLGSVGHAAFGQGGGGR